MTSKQKRVNQSGEKARMMNAQIPEPPKGIELVDDEPIIWEQFCLARDVGTWIDFDLIVIAKAVKIESRIRKLQLQLDSENPVIENARGVQIINPLITVIDILQRPQMTIIRCMSLAQKTQSPQVARSKAEAQKIHMDRKKSINEESLIPTMRH